MPPVSQLFNYLVSTKMRPTDIKNVDAGCRITLKKNGKNVTFRIPLSPPPSPPSPPPPSNGQKTIKLLDFSFFSFSKNQMQPKKRTYKREPRSQSQLSPRRYRKTVSPSTDPCLTNAREFSHFPFAI